MRFLLLLLLIPTTISAGSFRLLDADEISVDAYRIGKHRDAYLPEDLEDFSKGFAFNLNLRMLEYLRWDNKLYANGTDSQIRHVGWEFTVRLDFGKIQPFYYHHSEHVTERERPSKAFPLQDHYGVRLIFHKGVGGGN